MNRFVKPNWLYTLGTQRETRYKIHHFSAFTVTTAGDFIVIRAKFSFNSFVFHFGWSDFNVKS